MSFLRGGKIKLSFCLQKLRIVALYLMLISVSTVVSAESAKTPDQDMQRKVAKTGDQSSAPVSVAPLPFTPDQVQTLSQIAGAKNGASAETPTAVVVEAPTVVKARQVESGRLEAAPASPDSQKAVVEVERSPAVDVPLAVTASQKIADSQAVHRSFEDFLREAKPMAVSAEGLQQFGYDLFATEPSSFAPVTNVPVPPEYVLGPGDEVKVQLFGKDNKDLVLVIDREGSVAFPQVGPITLAGLSFGQAKTMLSEMIAQKMIGNTASITMGQLRSIRVFALGDVFRPGSYTVSGLATLSHALFSSGGVKKMGSLRNIQLKRSGKPVVTLDLYDFLLRGDTSKDSRLLPGDVVFVPPLGSTVSIAGQVARPAIYEIKNERTVKDILLVAGGLMPNAYLDRALIERLDGKGAKKIVNISLTGVGLLAPVQNGDVIKVFSGTEFETNQVLLIGNVKRPGTHAWEKDMRVSSVVRSMDDLLPETFVDYGIIEREAPGNREPMLVRFRLGEILSEGGKNSAADLALQPRDKVYIFKRANFRQQPTVSISGSVQASGSYEFKRNMHLADLILAAGGVLRDTDMGMVEIYRTDPESKKINLLKVNLERAMAADPAADVVLQDLDRVVVHSVYETKLRDTVSIAGQVHKPTTVELTQGMRVSDLVFAGGSVTEFAFLKKATLTRYAMENGEKRISKHVSVDLSAALKGDESANLLLEPYDSLFITRVNDEPNTRTVAIAGEVIKPVPSMVLVDGMRVTDLVFAGGGLTEFAFLKTARLTRYSYENGEKRSPLYINIDLSAALKGDESANVVLQPYDSLYINRINDEPNTRDVVSIGGEVYRPSSVPLVPNMRISDLIFAGGGITDSAYLSKSEITRYSVENGERRAAKHFEVNLAAALRGDLDANLMLQPYDVLTVRRLANWRNMEDVTIEGEVRHPGKYPIEEGELLSSLLARVGGTTSQAYLPALVFTRESIRVAQEKQINDLVQHMQSQLADIENTTSQTDDPSLKTQREHGVEAAKRVLGQLKGTKATGRLVVRIDDINNIKGTEMDLHLRAGDRLVFPQKPDDVVIVGEVYSQNAILFDSSLSRDDYVAQAGLTRMSDKDEIYVVHVNGEVDQGSGGFFFGGGVGPGDTIVVPPDLQHIDWIDIALDWSRAMMQIGTTIAAGKAIGIYK
ncbi:MAG: SLBB domain-containing protein [Gallionella sp.]|nr:SLBB domain-containing protein [Gallionella sp.]MDD4959642.1 SLBB domain-containing protein [Gallionella sp.]